MSQKLSIIIPAYNEAATIHFILDKIKQEGVPKLPNNHNFSKKFGNIASRLYRNFFT